MTRLRIPLVALILMNVGEYATLVQWGIVEPWERAWHSTNASIVPDAIVLCVASIVVLATVAMAFIVSYPTLRSTFHPAVARVRVFVASVMALPCLLVLLYATTLVIPGLFFVLLFPLVPVGIALPFLLALTLPSPNGGQETAIEESANRRAIFPVEPKP